jgi:hypothetical protein
MIDGTIARKTNSASQLGSIVWGYVSKKQFISFHTTMNKITGLLLFLFPLTLPFLKVQYSVPLICAIATVAAIQEGIYITYYDTFKPKVSFLFASKKGDTSLGSVSLASSLFCPDFKTPAPQTAPSSRPKPLPSG